jgi:TolB-like protein
MTPGQIGGKLEPRIFLQTTFNETFAKFSPDGRWVDGAPGHCTDPDRTEGWHKDSRTLDGILRQIAVMRKIRAGAIALTAKMIAPRQRGAKPIKWLATLPLENLSHDPEQDYFAEGMTDELITDLAKISALRVISRTSVMQYKGTKKPIPQIARELNVDAVLEGTVTWDQGRVRITA